MMTTGAPCEPQILLHRMLNNSTYSVVAIAVDTLTNTGCINAGLLLHRVFSLIRRCLIYHTDPIFVRVLSHPYSKWATANRNTGHTVACNTLTSPMCKGCLCMCVILCGRLCMGLFMQSSGEAQYVRVKLCVFVVLPSLAQCRRPTVIKAASHTDLALHYSYSSLLQKCGDGKHLNKWIQVSILKMKPWTDANKHFT